MKPKRLHVFVLMGILVLSGCQAQRIQLQGIGFRDAVTEIYTDQILNNLIRAKNNQLFVQLRLRDLTVEEVDTAELGGSFGDTTTRTRELAMAAESAATHTRDVVGTFSIDPKLSRVGTLSFQADPLVEREDVYQMIIDFAKDKDCFRSSKCDPERNNIAIHPGTKRKYKGRYYWVTKQAAPQFMILALKASFGGLEAIKGYYEVTIADVQGVEGEITYFVFDVPVPNDEGYVVVVTPNEEERQIAIVRLQATDTTKLGAQTPSLVAAFSPPLQTLDELKKLYKGKRGRVYLSRYGPEVAEDQEAEDVSKIRANVNLLRLDRLRSR